ncbi:MAG: U32 family peptidase [Clostridia bacterium]|nr:U32 family peptidase [Clostridia bacterium]
MKNPELLSPVGDFECLKAAVQNGANAVYLGAASFSARAKATNFAGEELFEAIKYAKLRNVAVHLALNTLIKNEEFNDAVNLAVEAYNNGVDAIIIQDLGLAAYLRKYYPEIPIHGSTQMTVHNLEGVLQLEKLGFSRVVLSRELSIEEIKYIRENTNIELEVFIHGALCISYSGQCLLSSMIGGRSGNRGLCAQPCRLPYELIEENEKTISLDKGYLMSPRDNFGMEYLPELIKMGINSFKIEGRMKTPTYVGVVTKHYRKYIDLILNNISLDDETLKNMIKENLNSKNEETLLTDKEEITQVFNRGGFSTGHFKPTPNKELIFKDKPNNMGIYVGTISHINENKGHLKLKLENTLSVGDRISINNESYTVSELMIDNKNFETLEKGTLVKIGRMKGKISVGNKIYRIETAKLNKSILPTFKEDKNFRKVKLNGEIILKENTQVSFKVWSNEGFYKDLKSEITLDVIPQTALNKPISKEKIIEQLSKTGNTEFEFENLNVIMDNNLFIQMSILNDLRRTAIEKLENLVLEKYTRNLGKVDISLPSVFDNTFKSVNSNYKPISLLLNILNPNFAYNNLSGIDKLYIPLNYFINPKFETILNVLTATFNTYIYMPHILKDKKEQSINFENIVSKFNVKGFVISHISQLESISKFGLDLIANFNLNTYSNISIQNLANYNFSSFTSSVELEKDEINNLNRNANLEQEVIVYGKIPVMTNGYCYLGKSNRCYKECDRKCENNSKFYLKDRMDFKFRIVPDNTSTLTTVYNSKTLSVKYDDIICDSIRIDILDENLDEIQEIIDTVKSGNRFEGKDYTNGKF